MFSHQSPLHNPSDLYLLLLLQTPPSLSLFPLSPPRIPGLSVYDSAEQTLPGDSGLLPLSSETPGGGLRSIPEPCGVFALLSSNPAHVCEGGHGIVSQVTGVSSFCGLSRELKLEDKMEGLESQFPAPATATAASTFGEAPHSYLHRHAQNTSADLAQPSSAQGSVQNHFTHFQLRSPVC